MSSPSEQTILITGASGYVGTHVVAAFLSAGYKVRAAVRNEKSASDVRAAHAKHAKNLSFAIVPDMTATGSFNEAVQGVTGVMHVASPFVLKVTDNVRDLLEPAVHGTVNILNSVEQYGTEVKRLVLTSSFAAILDLSQGYRPGYTYTEADWNPCTYEEASVTDQGGVAYCASKAFAEKAAWDWMETHKAKFTLTSICPPWIFGPPIAPILSLNKLGESLSVIYNLIKGDLTAVPAADFAAFADARDVALAHLSAFEVPQAAKERFLVATGSFDYQTACDILRSKFPELRNRIPEGKVGSGVEGGHYGVDGSKAARILGLKYTSLEQTLEDTVKAFLQAEQKSA